MFYQNHNSPNFYFFLFILIITSLYPMFSTDLTLTWFMMEINNFIFLSYMLLFMNNKKMSFLYFFIQLLASSIMLISIMMNYLIYINNPIINYMMLMAICLKLGMPPLHFWMPIMSIYMNWNMILLFLTIQKIIPLMMISFMQFHSLLLLIFVLLSLLVPPFMTINLTNFKKILTYSSINQTGWMIIIILSTSSLWLIYMLIYFLSLMMVLMLITTKKITYMTMTKSNIIMKILALSLSMNLSGLPPFMFFMMKWYSILLFIMDSKMNIMVIMMLLSSLIMMYVYINMIIKISLTDLYYLKSLQPSHVSKKFYSSKMWFMMSIINLSFLILLM